MTKFFLLTLLTTLTVISARATVAQQMASEMLTGSLQPRSFAAEMKVLGDFAEAMKNACQDWNPQAFVVQKDLAEACQFPRLFKSYEAKLASLQQPEASGLHLPEVDIAQAELPLLISGAWQRVIFSEADGVDSAAELIVLRMALEKSLRAQGEFIRHQGPQKLFKPFAALVVPRMVASFSGYSQTLRTLVILKEFRCGAEKTPACIEVRGQLEDIQAQVLLGIGDENFLAGLQRMTSENSARDVLKAKKVQTVVQLISQVKQNLGVEQIQQALAGQNIPLYAELKAALEDLSYGTMDSGNTPFANMLAAVSILAEIDEIQKIKTASLTKVSNSKPGTYSEQTSEEMNKLKSLVWSVLTYQEVVK